MNNLLNMLKSLADIKSIDELQFLFNRNKVWIHIKSDKLYMVDDVAYNCTNDSEGQVMVIYKPLYEKFDHPVYTREINEFLEKFKPQV